ncbi:hypothetical protein [Dokdonia sp.]|uniref:hypothetical protein n=1 Tax=Dokdonia sp. TaxID=2024995 RepID=UPI003267256B
MKIFTITTIVIFLCLLFSCSEDDKATQLIDDGVSEGAFIRTLDFTNSDLVLDDLSSTFSVDLEAQIGAQDGLDNIQVYARFKDNNFDNGNQSTSEVLVKTLGQDFFAIGPNDLPRTTLELTYEELIGSTNTQADLIQCKDQFLLRLVINLSDGRSFSVEDGSSSAIIAFDTIFSSPFCYTLNITAPIAAGQFVGTYTYQSIIDGPIGPTFGPSNTVNISVGESPNTRVFEANYIVSRLNEPKRPFRFVISCDEILFRKNQLSSFFSWCRPEGGFSFGGPPILLGPDVENAPVNLDDDTTFELWFVEGYSGWDGDCDFGVVPVKIQFTKQ